MLQAEFTMFFSSISKCSLYMEEKVNRLRNNLMSRGNFLGETTPTENEAIAQSLDLLEGMPVQQREEVLLKELIGLLFRGDREGSLNTLNQLVMVEPFRRSLSY